MNTDLDDGYLLKLGKKVRLPTIRDNVNEKYQGSFI